MKASKILSIISLVLAGITIFMFFYEVGTGTDFSGTAGWAFFLAALVIAQSIVVIVQANKNKKV